MTKLHSRANLLIRSFIHCTDKVKCSYTATCTTVYIMASTVDVLMYAVVLTVYYNNNKLLYLHISEQHIDSTTVKHN